MDQKTKDSDAIVKGRWSGDCRGELGSPMKKAVKHRSSVEGRNKTVTSGREREGSGTEERVGPPSSRQKEGRIIDDPAFFHHPPGISDAPQCRPIALTACGNCLPPRI